MTVIIRKITIMNLIVSVRMIKMVTRVKRETERKKLIMIKAMMMQKITTE